VAWPPTSYLWPTVPGLLLPSWMPVVQSICPRVGSYRVSLQMAQGTIQSLCSLLCHPCSPCGTRASYNCLFLQETLLGQPATAPGALVCLGCISGLPYLLCPTPCPEVAPGSWVLTSVLGSSLGSHDGELALDSRRSLHSRRSQGIGCQGSRADSLGTDISVPSLGSFLQGLIELTTGARVVGRQLSANLQWLLGSL
jgi:hypothetical protein